MREVSLVLAGRPVSSQGSTCSRGPERADSKLLYTGQVDKNVEAEIESEQLCLAVQFLFFYLRKQDFLSIVL